jgi:hypothetical protein
MTIDEIMRFIPSSEFQFITLEKAIILHEVVIEGGHVYVMGDDHAFEWVVWEPKREITYSNAGYSIVGVALRDGLIVGCNAHEADPAYEQVGGKVSIGVQGVVS